jgi:hypothetical protein
LYGGTEKNHEKTYSGYPVSGPRFEPGRKRILSRNVKDSTRMFHNMLLVLEKPIKNIKTYQDS